MDVAHGGGEEVRGDYHQEGVDHERQNYGGEGRYGHLRVRRWTRRLKINVQKCKESLDASRKDLGVNGQCSMLASIGSGETPF
jgi:hypothetical protein